MLNEELQIIANLTSVNTKEIKFSDAGFLSRGYIIDNGRIVFKFKKYPEISYENEIKNLNYINSLGLGINIQRVGWVSKDDSYLGVHGVIGESLKAIGITDEKREDYGRQIASFLKELHSIDFPEAETLTVKKEINAWQERFERSKDLLLRYFNNEETEKMASYIYASAPKQLASLGEKMVFSHGDLGMGNIFVDGNDRIGIIDFSDSMYLDEAADFMDIEDDKLCAKILDSYNADDLLREKVAIRRVVHPMFVINTYRDRPEEEILCFVDKIRMWLR